MIRRFACAAAFLILNPFSTAAETAPAAEPTATPAAIETPALVNWTPLPKPDAKLSKKLAAIVTEAGLDGMTPADKNPDKEDEWSSICLVDLSDRDKPRVAGWKEENFVYPASTYKMYVLGEVIREVVAGEKMIDEVRTVKKKNVRDFSKLQADQEATVSEILRLMVQESDNTAANEAIDLVDRRRVTALMHALGCQGSEITRKFIARSLEDPGYADAPGTTTNALHAATYLYAVETGAIGGGRGRGLIKSYLAMDQTDTRRFRAGLPPTATVYSKTGSWNTFTSEAAIVEDGKTRYILCAFTAIPVADAEAKLADLAKRVHEMMLKK